MNDWLLHRRGSAFDDGNVLAGCGVEEADEGSDEGEEDRPDQDCEGVRYDAAEGGVLLFGDC